MRNSENKINELFDLLDKWRYFPAYQLERRADIFFAIYLKELIFKCFQFQIDTIIPEFPVRVGTVYNNGKNESFRMDYVAVCQEMRKVFLVELKTDGNSVREPQIRYFKKAREINIDGLIDDLIKIYDATYKKNKYQNLLQEVVKLGWLTQSAGSLVNLNRRYDIDILFILPKKEQIEQIVDLQNEEFFKVLTFDNIIQTLASKPDEVSKRFIQSLEQWKASADVVVE
jgi:hypothetical protein